MEAMDGTDVDGYVMGDVIGRRRHHHGHGAMVPLPPRPPWRGGNAAPGIHLPREGRELLTMTPDLNGGQFDTSNIGSVITFTGRPQRPFEPQRLIARVARVADAVTGVPAGFCLSRGVFVGTQPQIMNLGEFDVEIFGPTSFDTMFQMTPAIPGIDITTQIRLSIAPTNTQKVQVAISIMGMSLGN